MGKHPLKGSFPGLYDPEQEKLEELEDKFLDEFWFAGVAQKKGLTPDDVDPDELEIGTWVEMEHTDNEAIAQRIALDHISEYPDYYLGLSLMETLLLKGALQDAIEVVRKTLGISL